MKLDRLLAIVMLLINRDIVQAKELSNIFGVSVRTIYRDLETINQAGIPIVTLQGAGGGVGIIDTYRIDRNVLKDEDIVSILQALNGLNSSLIDEKTRHTIEKIASLTPQYKAQDLAEKTKQVVIDFRGWEQDDEQQNKLNVLKSAIDAKKVVLFSYTAANGSETKRLVEPVQIYFKARSWYLYAFCQLRGEYRFFKVARMAEITIQNECFTPHAPCSDSNLHGFEEADTRQAVDLILKFTPEARGRIVEWFSSENIRQAEDGCSYVSVSYPEDEWVYGFILGFGCQVEVIEPQHIRTIIRERAEAIAGIYRKS